jgi:hypothetical protein
MKGFIFVVAASLGMRGAQKEQELQRQRVVLEQLKIETKER